MTPPTPRTCLPIWFFFPARLARARMDGRAGASSLQICRAEGVKGEDGQMEVKLLSANLCDHLQHVTPREGAVLGNLESRGGWVGATMLSA